MLENLDLVLLAMDEIVDGGCALRARGCCCAAWHASAALLALAAASSRASLASLPMSQLDWELHA